MPTGKSIEGLRQAVFMGNECKKGRVQPEATQKVCWLEDGRFWAGVHWSGGKFQSSVNLAFMGNEPLGF